MENNLFLGFFFRVSKHWHVGADQKRYVKDKRQSCLQKAAVPCSRTLTTLMSALNQPPPPEVNSVGILPHLPGLTIMFETPQETASTDLCRAGGGPSRPLLLR